MMTLKHARLILLTAIFAGTAVSTAIAQESLTVSSVRLSGTWIGVGPQKEARELSVKQDDATLWFYGGPDYRATFSLDGSETTMSAPDGKSLVVKAGWKGKKLVVTVHDPEMGQDIRRQTWEIDRDGQLVIGTEYLGGEPRTPTEEVFKRR